MSNLVPLRPLTHARNCWQCKAKRAWRQWARVRDAAGTALVLIAALAAIYLLGAVLNSLQPPAVSP